MEELEPLVAGLADRGTKRIDLNTGCPFPLQTARGRGAAFVRNVEEFSKIPELLSHYPDVAFSLKMRLGFSEPEEWRGIIDILNSMKLEHVAVHPRVAKEQYGGELHLDQFLSFLAASDNPVVFNGELKVPEDFQDIIGRFPTMSGVMTGRGVLGRPSLVTEVREGKEWDEKRRLDTMMKFHDRLFDHYSSVLNGDHQVLSKIKPFWEYSEAEIGRKAWKAISKANNLAKYTTALSIIR
ncbi:MAG: tRNA-dihydrouridine synthase family protein, partial [Muribaculaceae bacterium]|nr:tRNA-dihydrouridine synthase family protein [Muribaculaceae bacterium]